MKYLINTLSIFLFSLSSHAGVTGSGSGPRPTDILFVSGLNGGSGGGVGPRPGADIIFTQEPNIDFVQAVESKLNGDIKFRFRGYDSKKIEIQTLNINDLNEKYVDALIKSQENKSWEPVSINR